MGFSWELYSLLIDRHTDRQNRENTTFPQTLPQNKLVSSLNLMGFFYNLYTYKHSSAVDIHTSYMYASNYSEENKNNYKLSDITT